MNYEQRNLNPGGVITRRQFFKYSAVLIAGIAVANNGLALAAPSLEAAAVTGLSGSMINYQRDRVAPAYLARPAGNGTFPAMVVLHASRGLTADIKNAADRLAEAGFVALAPDLYRGQIVADHNQWAEKADVAKMLLDIQQGMDYLTAQRGVQPGKVGVLAFGFSDGLAFALAQSKPQVGATVVLYDVDADPVRLIPLPRAFRTADPRGFGPLILSMYSPETPGYGRAAATDYAWEHALRWLKYNLSA